MEDVPISVVMVQGAPSVAVVMATYCKLMRNRAQMLTSVIWVRRAAYSYVPTTPGDTRVGVGLDLSSTGTHVPVMIFRSV